MNCSRISIISESKRIKANQQLELKKLNRTKTFPMYN